MSRVTGTLKAVYNFLAGDPILLATVLVAFALATLLTSTTHAANVLVAVLFIGVIAGGLALTLSREVRGRQRMR